MRECWNNDPLHRPLFSDLVENFDSLLTMAKESNYLEMSEAYHGSAGPPEYSMGWKSAYARQQPGLFTSNTGMCNLYIQLAIKRTPHFGVRSALGDSHPH